MVPEFRWPMTPLTLASTSLLATAVPCFGSAASSSASSSNLAFLPPMVTPLALRSSIAMRAPFSLSLPRWAMPPLVGPTWPILTTMSCADTEPAKIAAAAAAIRFSLNLHANTSGIGKNRIGVATPEARDDNAIAGPARIGTFIDNASGRRATSAVLAPAELARDRARDDVAHRRGELLSASRTSASVARARIGASASRRRTSSISSTWRCRSASTRWVSCTSGAGALPVLAGSARCRTGRRGARRGCRGGGRGRCRRGRGRAA